MAFHPQTIREHKKRRKVSLDVAGSARAKPSYIVFVFSLQAKYEAMLREKNKLLQATKDLQVKIKTLQEKQSEILISSPVNKLHTLSLENSR